jgi:hypothetical protein
VAGSAADSAIADGKALYVVDVPDSERAPHQSRLDLLYYVRLGNKSQPASHRIIEDIRNRARHPSLDISLDLDRVWLPNESLPRVAGPMTVRLQATVTNAGKVKASNSCIKFEMSHGHARFVNFDNAWVIQRAAPNPSAIFCELNAPVYPGMQLRFWFDVSLEVDLLEPVPMVRGFLLIFRGSRDFVKDAQLAWTVFADNSPAKAGTVDLKGLQFGKRLADEVRLHPQFPTIRQHYGTAILYWMGD